MEGSTPSLDRSRRDGSPIRATSTIDAGRRELRLLRGLPPYPGHGQRFHAHPFLGPDRRWVHFTEAVDGVSQVCRLDIADLAARDGCGWPDETNHA